MTENESTEKSKNKSSSKLYKLNAIIMIVVTFFMPVAAIVFLLSLWIWKKKYTEQYRKSLKKNIIIAAALGFIITFLVPAIMDDVKLQSFTEIPPCDNEYVIDTLKDITFSNAFGAQFNILHVSNTSEFRTIQNTDKKVTSRICYGAAKTNVGSQLIQYGISWADSEGGDIYVEAKFIQ